MVMIRGMRGDGMDLRRKEACGLVWFGLRGRDMCGRLDMI